LVQVQHALPVDFCIKTRACEQYLILKSWSVCSAKTGPLRKNASSRPFQAGELTEKALSTLAIPRRAAAVLCVEDGSC
jgi:hypothetical protein